MREVLVFQLARFGDIVQSKRLMLSLQAEGDVRVHFCVDEKLTGIAAFVYPFAVIHGLPAHAALGSQQTNYLKSPAGAVLAGAKSTLAVLQSLDFERVYTLNASPLSHVLAALFPPETVHGYATINGQPMRDPWCRMASRLTLRRESSPFNLVDYWAFFHDNPVDPMTVNPVAGRAGTGRIGVVMAGRASRRSLPPEVLAGCMEAIFVAQEGPVFVCLGGKTERSLVRRVARHLSSRVLAKLEDLTGKTSLTDLPEVLSGLDCVLTPDTGIMHLAAHGGTPVQAFFLSSAWAFETGPYGAGHKIWQAVPDCAPCLESACCNNGLRCLQPFSHKSFLRYLSGRFDEGWPAGLNGYVTSFDEMGATCLLVDGHDPYTEERGQLRRCAAKWLESSKKVRFPGVGDPSSPTARYLYHERDWMLPTRRA